MTLEAIEGSSELAAPQPQTDSGIYEPLDISHDQLRAKLPYASKFIQTRIVNIAPELSAAGQIQCSLHTCCIFVETLHGDWLADDAEQSTDGIVPVNRAASPIEEEEPNSQKPLKDYVALSYVWGPDRDHKVIEVNSQPFRVRSNLWEFLNHARTTLPWLSNIWIDALCINQTDIDERNYQVKGMGAIYAEASQVLVWLGTGLEVFDQTLDIASEYSERAPHPILADSDKEVMHDVCQRQGITPPEFAAVLDKFLNLEYWIRAWVVQEFFLARDLLIVSASKAITYEVLARALRAAIDYRDDSLVDESVRERSLYTYIIYISDRENFLLRNPDKWRRGRLYRGLAVSQFTNAHEFKCSDPKDRIYSQLALVNMGWKFPVDYREDNYTLFLRAILFCFGDQETNEALFFYFWTFVQALDLGPESTLNILFARAQDSEEHRKMLSEFKQKTVLYKTTVYDWHLSDEGDMKCPDCGISVTPGNGASAFDRFCCLRLKQKPNFFWQCHISFPSVTKDDIHDSLLVAHFEHSKQLIRQDAPVDAANGARLNLLTCLGLWEGHVDDMVSFNNSQPE